MDKQTKGKAVGYGVADSDKDYTNSQLGKTASGVSPKKIGTCKRGSMKSRSDHTPNPRVG
jgi:hypothetical protein